MKKSLLITLALCMGLVALQARPVDVATAQRLGQQFVQHKALFAKHEVADFSLAYTFRADDGMATAYVFNFAGGFVVVAADDCSAPILGYSDCGLFDAATAPDGLLFMLDEISNGVAKLAALGHAASSDILCQWENLEAFGVLHPDRGTPVVGPLVQQRWNQDAPYNMYVPSGCPTGCVATAMAQLMKYWEWPVTGTGEHSYIAAGYGEQYANFGATTYDWANMIDYYGSNATQEQKEAVAVLMKHCGVSVNMMYAPDGSGAYSQDVPEAISTYFSYSDHATHIGKGGSYSEWIALLKSNIDQNIPLYYSGQSSQGGHAFVCDGYDADDLFHFNWGWGGSSNGYFLIDGDGFEYSGSQAIIYDFIPDFTYQQMPQAPENLSVVIDSDVSLTGHLSWTNPTETMTGEALASIEKVVVKRNGSVVGEVTGVAPGQSVSFDDEVPYFDQFEYCVQVVNGNNIGRTTLASAVFGPYCQWTVIMTSASFQGWDGGGITVQNAAGSYIDFLTTNTATASMQKFQMALGNNNLYWTEPNSAISNLSFKVKDAENQLVYEYSGPSSGLEAGLIKTLNNSCGNENTCEAPYNLKAVLDPDDDRTVVLTWDSDHTPEFGYCIYRDGFLFNMAHDTQYVDADTEIGGHCYYITALCNGGETVASNEYCITAGSGCQPATDLYFDYTTNSKVQLNWTASENENVSGYVIYRKTPETAFKIIKRVTTTNFKDNGVNPETVYHYAVAAYYSETDCYSGYANDLFDEEKFFIEVGWSQNPSDLRATVDEAEPATVELAWKPSYTATRYDIVRDGQVVATVSYQSSYTDENLALGQTYCYKVIAYGADFELATDEVCVTLEDEPVLPCTAPSDFRREEAVGMARMAWDAPQDREPDSYTVVVIDHVLNDTTEMTGLDELYYEESIPTELTDKSFKVKAVYAECESEFALTAEGQDFIRITNLGLNESALLSANLYPNPTSGKVVVKAEGMTSVKVYNIVGQCVMEKSGLNGEAVLDMKGWQNGVYFVEVGGTSGSVTEKVVKI